MEFFSDSKIDFMKYRKVTSVISIGLAMVGILTVFVQKRLNVGVDFAGGTQITVKFREQPDIESLRGLIEERGIADAQIQRFGEPGANEVIIKTPSRDTDEAGEDQGRGLVVAALSERFNGGSQGFDLNRNGTDALADLLIAADPEGQRAVGDEESAAAHYRGVADQIIAARKRDGLIATWDGVSGAGISPEVSAYLQSNTEIGAFSVLGTESVGPQIGAELRQRGVLAVAFSLIGMLFYIWYRFELRFGIGALVALLHDVLVTLGLYAIAGFEFNLTTIAAFLTLVGYSVNDSVVVFDRVRENMRLKRSMPLVTVMNKSINQTLSRTILTSGTTLLVVASLFFLGGDVLKGFAFILMIGVLIGTYSSIYVASPFALLWERFRQTRATASA